MNTESWQKKLQDSRKAHAEAEAYDQECTDVCTKLTNDMAAEYAKTVENFKLDKPDTSMAVLDAIMDEMIKLDTEHWSIWESELLRVSKMFEPHILNMLLLTGVYEEMLKEVPGEPEIQDKFDQLHDMIADAQDDMHSLRSVRGQDNHQLQMALHRLVKDQNAEVKKWWYSHLPFADHLGRRSKSCPKVELRGRDHVNAGFLSGHVPVEISSLIFSHCDLESCVQLRQVSSFWYTMYRDSDLTLGDMLWSRDPFFRPDAEIKTWGHCVLVFVARLRNWSSVAHLDDIELDFGRPKPVRLVIAPKLEYGEKLPTSFQGLEEHDPGCTHWCDHLTLNHDSRIAHFNPWTLESEVEDLELSVGLHEDSTLLCTQGFHIHLPNTVQLDDIDPVNCVTFLRSWIDVCVDGQGFVFPRYKPLHYSNAVTYVPGNDEQVMEVGGVFLLSHSVENFTKEEYFFHDGEELTKYTTTAADPVAFYKGMLWWHTGQGDHLVPTFVDKQTPDKVYYKKDTAIRVDQHTFDEFGQVHKYGNSQFLVAESSNGYLLVDLETGSVTNICSGKQSLGENELECYFAGFEGPRFWTRCMDYETVEKYTSDAFRES